MSDEVNPYGKIFVGDELSIEMAVFNQKNKYGLQDVLLKMTGAPAYDAGIDGKTIRYNTVPAGSGQNFNVEYAGSTHTRMLSRSSWGSWEFFEVFLNNKTYKVALDSKKSGEVRPLHLLTQYKSALGEVPGKLTINRAVDTAQSAVAEMGWKGKLSIDWGDHEPGDGARRVLLAAVKGLVLAFQKILADDLGREAMASVKSVVVRAETGSTCKVDVGQGQMKVLVGDEIGTDGIDEQLIDLMQDKL